MGEARDPAQKPLWNRKSAPEKIVFRDPVRTRTGGLYPFRPAGPRFGIGSWSARPRIGLLFETFTDQHVIDNGVSMRGLWRENGSTERNAPHRFQHELG